MTEYRSAAKRFTARHFPVRPNLDQLRNQAKDLLRAIRGNVTLPLPGVGCTVTLLCSEPFTEGHAEE